MEENLIEIPKKEVRPKLLGFKASVREAREIRHFCKHYRISKSDFFRLSIRQIIKNF